MTETGAMLFWTRAAVCIGAVTFLAIQRLPAPRVEPVRDAVAGWPAQWAVAACRRHPEACAAAAAQSWRALAPTATPRPGEPRRSGGIEGTRPAPVANAGRSLT